MKTKLLHMAISYENLSSEFRKLVDDGTLIGFQVIEHPAQAGIKKHFHNYLIPAKSIDWDKLYWDLHEYPLMRFVPLV